MTKEIQHWSDPAMYVAQPITKLEPEVYLISCTPDPLGEIAHASLAYNGKFVKDRSEVTDEDRRHYWAEVKKSALEAPLEFVNLSFTLTGVTRSFTHQLVRQRSAVYCQESMRFAVKDPLPVALPPSLADTVPWKQWEIACGRDLFPVGNWRTTVGGPAMVRDYAQRQASKAQLWRRDWDEAIADIGATYSALIESGMPAEDARGLAPHATLTQVNYHTSLRHLKDHAGLRLCSQAQQEWRTVWAGILKAIRGQANKAPKSERWQYEEIAQLFKPVCYAKGHCAFMADVDRYCTIREDVNEYAKRGVPSRDWEIDLQAMYSNPNAAKPPRMGGEWAGGGQGPKDGALP